MTDIRRRRLTHLDRLEAALRWAIEYYARPAIEVARASRGTDVRLRRELRRLEDADALLTEGGQLGSTRLPIGSP